MQLGAHQVLLNMDIQFQPDMPSSELFAAIDRVKDRIRQEHPEISNVFVEVEALPEGRPDSKPS